MPVPNPKVSVLMITYNQEKYIAQAVQSALDQTTDFDYEIVIGEDCSTDRTREILQDFERQSPNVIRLLQHETNLGGTANFHATWANCRGEYVAILEGDDYWTDFSKLQLQADALDQHPDWSSCFHRARIVYESGNAPVLFPDDDYTRNCSFSDLLDHNFIATATVMFRQGLYDSFPDVFLQLPHQDWPLHLLNAEHGMIGYLDRTMAVFRKHTAGQWSAMTETKQWLEIFKLYDAFEDHFRKSHGEEIRAARLRRIERLCDRIDELYGSRSYRFAAFFMTPLRRIADFLQGTKRTGSGNHLQDE